LIEAIAIAFGITLINALAAFLIAKRAQKKETKEFNKIIIGSMVVRYFINVIAVWFCLKVLNLLPLPFALTFMISTFILIFIEILLINYRANLLNLQNLM